MGVKHMQGVSAQLEYLHTTDKIRRYPTHCIFCEGKERICTNPHAGYYRERCRSSSKCDDYEEQENPK